MRVNPRIDVETHDCSQAETTHSARITLRSYNGDVGRPTIQQPERKGALDLVRRCHLILIYSLLSYPHLRLPSPSNILVPTKLDAFRLLSLQPNQHPLDHADDVRHARGVRVQDDWENEFGDALPLFRVTLTLPCCLPGFFLPG